MIECTLSFEEKVKRAQSQNTGSVDEQLDEAQRIDHINRYIYMDKPIETIEKLARETVALLSKAKEPRIGENNISTLSRAIRNAEQLYLSVKGAAASFASNEYTYDAVLSNEVKPSKTSFRDGIFQMEFPFLMPYRYGSHKTKFFACEVAERVKDLNIEDDFKRQHNYIIFTHYYPEDYDRKHVRDNDNTEDKWLLDALIGTVIADDSPEFCTLIYKTVFGSDMKTEVVVTSRENALKNELI